MRSIDAVILGLLIALHIIGGLRTSELTTKMGENHTEIIQLINTEKQAEIAFLESLKKAKPNRIKKGDELR